MMGKAVDEAAPVDEQSTIEDIADDEMEELMQSLTGVLSPTPLSPSSLLPTSSPYFSLKTCGLDETSPIC